MGVSQFVLRAAETGSKPKLPSDALKIAEYFGRRPTELWEV